VKPLLNPHKSSRNRPHLLLFMPLPLLLLPLLLLPLLLPPLLLLASLAPHMCEVTPVFTR
jgi:hypothetical protein